MSADTAGYTNDPALRGLHDIAVAVALADGMAADRVLLVILNEKRFSVFLFALDAVFIRGNFPAAAHGRRG